MSQKTKDFFKKVYSIARKNGATDAQAKLAAVQASLETGYGEKVKGQNFFGIKAGKSWTGPTVDFKTTEYLGKGKESVVGKFRKYDSLEESIQDYIEFMPTRYPSAWEANTIEEAAKELKNGKFGAYASDPKYASKVTSISNSNSADIDPKQDYSNYVIPPEDANDGSNPQNDIYRSEREKLNDLPASDVASLREQSLNWAKEQQKIKEDYDKGEIDAKEAVARRKKVNEENPLATEYPEKAQEYIRSSDKGYGLEQNMLKSKDRYKEELLRIKRAQDKYQAALADENLKPFNLRNTEKLKSLDAMTRPKIDVWKDYNNTKEKYFTHIQENPNKFSGEQVNQAVAKLEEIKKFDYNAVDYHYSSNKEEALKRWKEVRNDPKTRNDYIQNQIKIQTDEKVKEIEDKMREHLAKQQKGTYNYDAAEKAYLKQIRNAKKLGAARIRRAEEDKYDNFDVTTTEEFVNNLELETVDNPDNPAKIIDYNVDTRIEGLSVLKTESEKRRKERIARAKAANIEVDAEGYPIDKRAGGADDPNVDNADGNTLPEEGDDGQQATPPASGEITVDINADGGGTGDGGNEEWQPETIFVPKATFYEQMGGADGAMAFASFVSSVSEGEQDPGDIELPRVSEMMHNHANTVRQLSQMGLNPTEEAQFRSQITRNFNAAVKAVKEISGGNRGAALAGVSSANAQRNQAEGQLSLQDMQLKRQALMDYGNILAQIDSMNTNLGTREKEINFNMQRDRAIAQGEAMGNALNQWVSAREYQKENAPGSLRDLQRREIMDKLGITIKTINDVETNVKQYQTIKGQKNLVGTADNTQVQNAQRTEQAIKGQPAATAPYQPTEPAGPMPIDANNPQPNDLPIPGWMNDEERTNGLNIGNVSFPKKEQNNSFGPIPTDEMATPPADMGEITITPNTQKETTALDEFEKQGYLDAFKIINR